MFDGRETEPGTAELDPGLMPKPGSTPETAVPVSEVNAAVRHVLEQSFAPLWIRGEPLAPSGVQAAAEAAPELRGSRDRWPPGTAGSA